MSCPQAFSATLEPPMMKATTKKKMTMSSMTTPIARCGLGGSFSTRISTAMWPRSENTYAAAKADNTTKV